MISATLASLITSINNWVRIKEIKNHASSLHKDNMDKTENFFSAISHSLTSKGTETLNGSRESLVKHETLLEEVKSTIKKEFNQITNILNEHTVKNFNKEDVVSKDGDLSSRDVSFVRIAGSMLTGAIIGTLITACFLGSTGGPE